MRAAPEALTRTGRVRGAWSQYRSADGRVTDHAFFRGIPFAAAPVGDARFAAPQPPAPWDGVREAVLFGPTPQRRTPYDPPRIPEPSIPGDETLTVNVTTPEPRHGAGLPVLVWIHGGGFIAGSPASPWYRGEAFARDGVVTVTCSYRLGFEGFGIVEGAPTNRGVRDWIAALEWVQDNIAAFGGDPATVAIAGQSAGGAAVMRLLTMPVAQPLFSRVLAVSPADASSSMERTRAASSRIAAAVGATLAADDLARRDEIALYEARDHALDAAEPDDPVRGMLLREAQPLALGPCVDGDLITMTVAEALAWGVGDRKPLLIGACAHEFNQLTADLEPQLAALGGAGALELAGIPAPLAARMAAREPERGAAWALGQGLSDVVFRQAVARFSRLRAESDAPTWTYDFRWESLAPTVHGAGHCVDVPFGFDILGVEGTAEATGPAPQSLADDVHRDWLGLIADGAVDAPRHGADAAVILYGADASRSVGTAFELENELWDVSREPGKPPQGHP